jgi:hypothetical protein
MAMHDLFSRDVSFKTVHVQKTNKWEIKTWGPADSSNGYLTQYQIYKVRKEIKVKDKFFRRCMYDKNIQQMALCIFQLLWKENTPVDYNLLHFTQQAIKHFLLHALHYQLQLLTFFALSMANNASQKRHQWSIYHVFQSQTWTTNLFVGPSETASDS